MRHPGTSGWESAGVLLMERKQSCCIVFSGDIGFDRYMDRKWEDENLLSPEILEFFHSADHAAVDVEGALLKALDDGSRGVFFHAMDPAAVSLLEKIRADFWCIGNNHIMDAGAEGIISSKKLAKENGAVCFGAGLDIREASEPVYLPEAGGIGMISVAYLNECIPATETEPGIFPWNDMVRIEERICEIKSRCRWCVIVSHGGEEFSPMPMPFVRDRYLEYLRMGADVVVALHPHVAENYEILEDGKMIFYSLGNFIFDTPYQRAHRYTDAGVLLKLIFTEDDLQFEAMGTRIIRGEEHIEKGPLPKIFTNVPADQYELLAPLAAKALAEEDKRKMIFLEPERFTKATDDVWNGYFFSTEPDGYFEGQHMDFGLIIPLAEKAENGDWQKSHLTEVKEYISQLL